MKKIALIVAAGVLLLADVILLAGVWANRGGEPESVLTLTERELRLPTPRDDNSALMLRLNWRGADAAEDWDVLSSAKLHELGFDTESARSATKPVYAALELQPDTGGGRSRLFLVDLGVDRGELRKKYQNGKRYAVMEATVHMYPVRRRDAARAEGSVTILPATILVSPKYAGVFDGLGASAGPVWQPRYQVNLCFGNKGEPWVCGAERLQ